ncbi:MAG: DNA cytosine methyltransferase [Pseudomonadota bacterium]
MSFEKTYGTFKVASDYEHSVLSPSHPKKILNKTPKIVSLFSGCGGMDLGFKKAGFDIIWANDFNHWACTTYANNFGNHVHEGDICDFPSSKIPDCDMIIGGFPCQDFSMIWKRGGIGTERGNLYRQFVRIVTDKQPKIFIAENVKGLLTANDGKAVQAIIDDFTNSGYNVELHKVNFANYGAPQLRERVLIIGIHKSINQKFKLPDVTHTNETFVSSEEALRGVKKVLYNNEHQNIQKKTVEMLKLIPAGGNFTSIPKDSPYYVNGMISHVYRRLHPKKPSTTIIAGGGGGTWGYHYEEPRPLTNRERARLFGYPDNFIFEGSITEVRRQIGNSVPPVGILPIAKSIKNFLDKVSKHGV